MLLSPPRTMVTLVVMVVTLLLVTSGPGQCQRAAEYDDDYDGEDGCHPEEADHCFGDVNQNLLCNLGKPVAGRNCTNRDADDLCGAMRDALECCEDILDSCTKGEGYYTFEMWLHGLKGVHRRLCRDDSSLELIKVLLKGSKCFRLKRFINCVEDRANLTHMADLLTTELDLRECNMIQTAVSACTEDSEKNKRACQGTSRAVTEAVIAFFTFTRCGQTLPSPPPQPLPPLPPCSPSTGPNFSDDDDTNNNNNSGTINEGSNKTTTTTTYGTTKSIIPTPTTSTINSTTKKSITTTTNTNIPKDTSSSANTTTTNNTNTSKAAPQVACQEDFNTAGTPTASTVVVTVLVTMVLVGLGAMVLLKRGVLVIRTDLDRRLIGLNDEDGNSAYDRF